MKKIIAMLVVATMLITGIMAIAASAVDTAVYTIDAVKDGDTLDVTVSISNKTPIGMVIGKLVYNADALEVDEDSIDAVWAYGKGTFSVAKNGDGVIDIDIQCKDFATGGTGITAEGTMFTVSFAIKDAAADYGLDIVTYNDDPDNHLSADLEAIPFEVVVNTSEVTTAPETTAPAPAETTAPAVVETTAPAAAETTAPAAAETTAPAAAETTAPAAAETTAPDAAETTKPVEKPSSPQTGDSMVFVAVIAVLALAACSTVVVVRSKKYSK